VLFLSGSTAGELSATPPSFIGSVVKPVLTRSTNGSGHIVVNYLGTQIGGSSTVAIDEIQPVGTIAPYAGGTIPDTWLECNGASYSVSDYAELHDKIRNTTGDRVPIYGYVARLNIAGTANITVGGYIQFKTSSAAWSLNTLYGSNADVTAVVITAEGSNNYLVQVLPNYSNSKFVFPNTVFAAGSLSNAANATANYRFLNSNETITTSITATVSGIAVIAFNTPDLRGRFAVGVNPAAVADGTSENDTAYNSALSAFALGEEGGSESIGSLVNVATWNATSAEPSVPSGSAVLKPPYLATKYIIKAKPYTRAAIVDGLDIPYSSLLVRDLRSRNVGGSNGDLVLHTNTAGDSGLGTERMRLTTGGNVGIATATPAAPLHVYGASTVHGSANSGTVLVSNSGNTRQLQIGVNDSASVAWIQGWVPGSGLLDLSLQPTSGGRVGIGTTSPTVALDVNGTVRIRGGGSPGVSLGDRLVAADTDGTLKWDTGLINGTDGGGVRMYFNPSTTQVGYGWTNSLQSTSLQTGSPTSVGAVYTATSITLPRGVYICQPYNNLTYSGNFRASAAYYGRIGLKAVTGSIFAISSSPGSGIIDNPGINFQFVHDTAGSVFSGGLPQAMPYEMTPFVFNVSSTSAVVKGVVSHEESGTMSVVTAAQLGLFFAITRIG
jgi:hypothetical protein